MRKAPCPWRFSLYGTTSAAHARFAARQLTSTAQKRPACAGLFVIDVVAAVSRDGGAMVPVMPRMAEPDRLQFDIGDSGRDVQAGLALHADRLQRVGILRTADQEVAAETDADRRIGADAAVIAGEFAASKPAGSARSPPTKTGSAR